MKNNIAGILGLVVVIAVLVFLGLYGKNVVNWAKYFDSNSGVKSDSPSTEDLVRARATLIVQALQKNDYAKVATLAHPEKGVTFSPYAHINSADLVFGAEKLKTIMTDPASAAKIYHWGDYDGSGMPMNLTFANYSNSFVYSRDFANAPDISFNKLVQTGNVPSNISEKFPGSVFVEYHFSGTDPQFGGNDWQSLRLVFEQWSGAWYLVGIVHDQWTI